MARGSKKASANTQMKTAIQVGARRATDLTNAVLAHFAAVADDAEQGASCGPGEATGEVVQVVEQGRSCGPNISAADAASLAQSTHLLATLESAAASLKACGAMKAVISLENEMRNERRRLRAMSNEDPAVLFVLARPRDI